jgi:hypothetical protein
MKNEPLRLKLIRVMLTEEYTEGVLINENTNLRLCDTLEDRVRDANADGTFTGDEKKIYGETAIPYGTYPIEVTYSPKFQRRMVAIHNVKHFEGIRLHWGRTAKNSLGCPLVGKKYDNGYLENSGMTNALVALLDKHGNKGTIEIV